MVFHDYKCKGVGKLQPDSVAHCASTDGVWGLLCVNVDTNVCTRVCMYMCVWWRAFVLLEVAPPTNQTTEFPTEGKRKIVFQLDMYTE